jgi:hypothetical protein
LGIDLEGACLRARDLLLKWLAVRRLHAGEVASVRRIDSFEAISVEAAAALALGEYRELRIETRRLVIMERDERKSFERIDQALSQVIAELKKVMAY